MEGGTLSSSPAYKFLRLGAIGPFSGYSWPVPARGRPADWVVTSLERGACFDGVHACERRHLARWIWEELWEIELDGEVQARGHKLRAERGRLVRRIDAWSPASARSFARACAGRAQQHAAAASDADAELAAAMAADGDARARAAEASADPYIAAHGAAVSAYISAMTALRVGGRDRHEAERDWQAGWLADALDLGG